jgi:hypothetical protein
MTPNVRMCVCTYIATKTYSTTYLRLPSLIKASCALKRGMRVASNDKKAAILHAITRTIQTRIMLMLH